MDEIVDDLSARPTARYHVPSGHSAIVQRTPGGMHRLIIPPTSIIRSAPPSGGVVDDDAPDDPDQVSSVADFPVTADGRLIGAPLQLVAVVRAAIVRSGREGPAGLAVMLSLPIAEQAVAAARRRHSQRGPAPAPTPAPAAGLGAAPWPLRRN